jgi:hypothetical protein
MKSDLEVKKVTKIEEPAAEKADETKSVAVSHKTAKSNVYSVSSHFKNAERNKP